MEHRKPCDYIRNNGIDAMYGELKICKRCGAKFEEPDYVEFCYEDEYGVGSLFGTRNYGEYEVCPKCGSERIEDYWEEEEEEDD